MDCFNKTELSYYELLFSVVFKQFFMQYILLHSSPCQLLQGPSYLMNIFYMGLGAKVKRKSGSLKE